MGRRKQGTGKRRSEHRRKSGPKNDTQRAASSTGSGDTGGAGPTAGADAVATGETTVVAIMATDHQIAPERAPMELIEISPAAEPIPENLAAEAAAALGQAPEEPALAPVPPTAPPYDPEMATEWDMYMQMAVGLVAKIVLPQWNLTDDEKHELTKSTAHILQDLFPGGLSGRFAPYLRLITVSGIIIISRHKEHGGKFPGIGPKREEVVSTQ